MDATGDFFSSLAQFLRRRTMVIMRLLKTAMIKWETMSASVVKLAKEFWKGKSSSSPQHSDTIDGTVDGMVDNDCATRRHSGIAAEKASIRSEGGAGQKDEETHQEDTIANIKNGYGGDESKEEEEEGGEGEEGEEGEGKAEDKAAALELFFSEKKKRRHKKSLNAVRRSARDKKCQKYGA